MTKKSQKTEKTSEKIWKIIAVTQLMSIGKGDYHG